MNKILLICDNIAQFNEYIHFLENGKDFVFVKNHWSSGVYQHRNISGYKNISTSPVESALLERISNIIGG